MAVEDYMNEGGEAQETPEREDEGNESESEGERALINASVCPGMKVGDTLELKVTAVRDGEYEVEYMAEGSPDDEEEDSAEASGAPESEGAGRFMEA